MNRIILLITVCTAIMLAFSSCKMMPRTRKADNAYLNLSYGTKLLQKLDVYLPREGSTRRGVVIAVHGGGWMAGSKEDMAECGRLCASEGYVTVSANYRLALNIGFQEPTITDMLDDIDAIKTFVKEHEPEWNCDSSRLALIGFSAGAHLSLMQTATRNEDGHIKACVSISGVSDLTDSQFHQNTIGLLKARIVVGIATGKVWDPEDPESVTLYKTLSPQFCAARINCPVVIIHGTKDRIVPVSQARTFRDQLAELGKEVAFVEGQELDHELESETFRKTLVNETLLPILRRTIH